MDICRYKINFKNDINYLVFSLNKKNCIFNSNTGNYIVKDNIIYFDCSTFLFDILDDKNIEILDKIFCLLDDSLNRNYLNTEIWNAYKEMAEKDAPNNFVKFNIIDPKFLNLSIDIKKKKAPAYLITEIDQLEEIYSLIKILDPETKIEGMNINGFMWSLRSFDKESIMENLSFFYDTEKSERIFLELEKGCFLKNYQKIYSYYQDKIIVENKTQLLYVFLDIVFNSDISVILRKCINCGKYFFTIPGKNNRCRRIYKNGKTCLEYKIKTNRDILEEQIRQSLKNNDKICITFNKNYCENLFIECEKNEDKYLFSLIEKFYKTESKRKEKLKMVGLNENLVKKMKNSIYDDKGI